MNYYPNYGNYGYNNYNQYMPQQNQMVQPQQQMVGLNGKIVDSEEMVKATDVPMGGYGIFPKADLSEIYVKSWNANGTTNIAKFTQAEIKKEPSQIEKVLERLEVLEAKIDAVIPAPEEIDTKGMF